MHETPRRLPLPIWLYVILGAFTFAPWAFVLVLIVLGILKGIVGVSWDLMFDQGWLELLLSIYLFSMWTIYCCWAIGTRHLQWPDKLWWVLMILGVNIGVWPIFFVFMIRRYLGLNQWDSPRGQAALAQWLKRHQLESIDFSDEQRRLLHRGVLEERFVFWITWVWVLLVPCMVGVCVYMFTSMMNHAADLYYRVLYMDNGIRYGFEDEWALHLFSFDLALAFALGTFCGSTLTAVVALATQTQPRFQWIAFLRAGAIDMDLPTGTTEEGGDD